MKITFVLPGYAGRPSGGYRVVYEYANGLARRGHEIVVVHPRSLFFSGPPISFLQRFIRELRLIFRLARKGTKIGDISIPWQSIDPKVKLVSVPMLWPRFIPTADVVVATHWRTAEYVSAYPVTRGKGFYLVQSHEIWDGSEARVNATWVSHLHKIVIAKWLSKLGESLGARPINHVPNAIDHENFHLTKPIENRKPRVAMLYSPVKWKGAVEGIAALEKARQYAPNMEAILFGVSSRPKDLPDWIQYRENPTQAELRDDIYNGSAIYLCPSWTEGWGLPITEAMACGCAIVSADNGGVHDFVENGVSGFIVPVRDSDALANPLCRLLLDENLRQRMAAAGTVVVKKFTYENSLQKLESLLIDNFNNK